jgi:hypothetical protein
MQRQFHWIVAHCGCHERVAEDVYCMAPTLAGLDFGVRSSYAAGTSSAVSTHDDYPDLGLDTTTDVLSQLEMLSTPRSLHNLCRVDEHASLCTI